MEGVLKQTDISGKTGEIQIVWSLANSMYQCWFLSKCATLRLQQEKQSESFMGNLYYISKFPVNLKLFPN